jgi:16S rRNA (uracil1498-N3)-methyltransferase
MIVPLMTARTEREHFRFDRLNNILISAMMQSQQYHLPLLKEPAPFKAITGIDAAQKLIAHCMDGIVRMPLHEALQPGKDTVICIGPEGDFTDDEVSAATAAGFTGISLGVNRLRTETAAMAVCAYFNMINA